MGSILKLSRTLSSLAILLGLAAAAQAGPSVYVLTAGNSAQNTAVQNLLTSNGFTVTMGPSYQNYTGSSLAGYSAVLLMPTFVGGGPGDMPAGGQDAILSFVYNGGGLLTSEWSDWSTADLNHFLILAPAFPFVSTTTYDYSASITYHVAEANNTLDSGVSSTFSINSPDNIGGTEVDLLPKNGAHVYFGSDSFPGQSGSGAGLIGWSYHGGSVLSFSAIAGGNDLSATNNPNFSTLFVNAVRFASNSAAIPLLGDANGDGKVDSLDLGIIEAHLGMSVADGYASGDFNGDGKVNSDDWALFSLGLAEYHQSLGIALPEPGCAAILAAPLALRCRRRGM